MMSRPVGWFVAIASWALFLPAGSASTIRDDVSDSAYTGLAADPAYAGVGMIVKNNGSQLFLSAGTLISSDWVLTAAHVVSDATALTFTINGNSYTADSWTYYPTYNSSTYGDDIGLLHLNASVANAAPASLYTAATSSLLGQTATFVGYGATGTGLTGYIASQHGTKRAVQNVLDTTENLQLGSAYSSSVLMSDFDNPHSAAGNVMGSATPLPLEGLAALGDSGGGVFVTSGGTTYLAAVTSVLYAPDNIADASYGDLSGCVAVPGYVGWIDATTGIVPEPSTLAMLVGVGVAWLAWRRRTRFSR